MPTTSQVPSIRAPILALTALVLFILALSAFSQWTTTLAANDLDVERSSRAVQLAIQGQIFHMESVADDNANWDDAATALYRPAVDRDFGWRGFGAVTSNEKIYESMFAIDGQGRQTLAFEDGKVARSDLVAQYGQPLQALIAAAKRSRASSGGLIAVGKEVRILGVGVVTPTSEALKARFANQPPVLIAFAIRLSPKRLESIEKGLQLEGMQFQEGPSASSIALADPLGKTIAFLGWRPSNPGYEAFRKATPILGLVLLMRLLALALVLSYSYRFYTELRRSALTDALSNLPNRTSLEFEVTRHMRRGEHISLAFLDLDGFKAVNDNYGHSVGDQLIRQCSDAARSLAANCTMVARLGGDEFAILAVGADADEHIATFIQSLLRRLTMPFYLGERTVLVGASAGMASRTPDVTDVEELMRRADIAMYVSKRSGKMQMTWFEPSLDQEQAEALQIDQRMREALAKGHFEVHYQPLVDARSGEVLVLEALLRWNDPDGQNLAADRFIPIAEETGLIDQIGLFVLSTACTAARAWPNVRLAINISAAQLRNPEFPAQLRAVLANTRFPATRLEVEITETYVVQNTAVAAKVLAEIQASGVCVVLDDFGTGFASIGFLRQFKFDTLKIDRSLVLDAVGDEGARAMVHASVVVARALGMTVVAEGIEHEAQAHLMRVAGCDLLQGWLYSKALTEAEVPATIEALSPADGLQSESVAPRISLAS